MMNMDAVAIGSVLALAATIVVLVIIGLKVRKEIIDQDKH
jgi:hypothetical protein